MDAKYAKIQKETEQLLNTVTSGIESFYAAQKVSGAKASLKQNSVLTGDYNTIEELEVAFYEQQDAINQSIQTLEAATNQQIQSSYNAFFGNSSAETQAWGTAAVGIANILSENSAERKKEQAMAELEASKKAKLKAMAASFSCKILFIASCESSILLTLSYTSYTSLNLSSNSDTLSYFAM